MVRRVASVVRQSRGFPGMTMRDLPKSILEFKPSPIHGLGAFALAPIRAGTLVIEYVGDRISKVESARQCEAGNAYIFELDDEYDIDGSAGWNPARFLNHSCAPNCD